jgi:anti-sigma28 factor (negative regulator of flagellin synthesis)
MQISNQEVNRVLRETTRHRDGQEAEAPVKSVEDLAAKHGVSMDEVRRFTERARMAEEDPGRERRVRELARKVQAGTYRIEAEQVVDMAERRAIADRSNEI